MNEQFENLYELGLVMVSKLSWYTEEAREKAYGLIREAQAAVSKKPATPKKVTAPLPENVEETPTGKIVKPRKDA